MHSDTRRLWLDWGNELGERDPATFDRLLWELKQALEAARKAVPDAEG